MTTILEKFTTHFKQVIYKAYRIALSTPEKTIKPEHLLWGLVQEKGSLASELLKKFELKVRLVTPTTYPIDHTPPQFIDANLFPLSPRAQRIIERAVLVAARYEHKYIGTEHLLHGIFEKPDDHILSILKIQSISLSVLTDQISTALSSTSRFPELAEFPSISDMHSNSSAINSADSEIVSESGDDTSRLLSTKERSNIKNNSTPALDFFATDLTSQAAQKRIDPVIGRSREIQRVIQILGRRNKNNPVLLGDPGVGKTAIVEGLAKRITSGDVPETLHNKRIYSLDMTLLVAGTIYRGEFESRFRQVLEELKNNPSIILFIDEIHSIMSVGSNSGSFDAAQILKPALARGEIRCIGATTYKEYKRYIENDSALERRFQSVHVPEVSTEEAVSILEGIKSSYEKHHAVRISSEAIEEAVSLSDRYMPEKNLPDKAIDLIDEAASRIKLTAPISPLAKQINKLESLLREILEKKQLMVLDENFPEALKLKEEEVKILQKLNSIRNDDTYHISWIGTVKPKDISVIVSESTSIPLKQLTQTHRGGGKALEKKLKQHIIGQSQVLKDLTAIIKRAQAGLSGHARPLGSFVFLGPSGVGKTETAKILARELFGTENSLIRFDMSEFSESFNVSKMIGAPAGYVGYQDGGTLTEAIRRQPYSLILFDEIEKAHLDVFNILLQVLDDGHLTDAAGKKVNFKNTIIIMTSNIGLDLFNQSAALGFGSCDTVSETEQDDISTMIQDEMKNTFRPEFINRIDRILVFNPLSRAHIARIADQKLNDLGRRLSEQEIALRWNKPVLNYIADTSFSPDEGARGVRKMIENEIESPLADLILSRKLTRGNTAHLAIKNSSLAIEPSR